MSLIIFCTKEQFCEKQKFTEDSDPTCCCECAEVKTCEKVCVNLHTLESCDYLEDVVD